MQNDRIWPDERSRKSATPPPESTRHGWAEGCIREPDFFHALMSILVVFVLLILIINTGVTPLLPFIYLAIGVGLLGFTVYSFERCLRSRKAKPEAESQDR